MDEMKKNSEEVLKGKVLKFLNEFEQSKKSEHDMKKILSERKSEIYRDAQEVGGNTFFLLKNFIDVCDDYANNRGMFERVKKEGEEIRLFLEL